MYVDHLQNLVSLINSRPKDTTTNALKTITTHDVLSLISLPANANPLRKQRYQIGDTGRIRF